MTDQAAEQSVMDRLTAHMEHLTGIRDEVAPEPSEVNDETPSLEEIQWEGETYQIPPKIKEALMRNADYTQKTQALAESRKQVDHIQELARQSQLEKIFGDSVAPEHQELSVIEAYLAQASKMDWSKLKTEDVLRTKIELDSIKERRDAVKQALAKKRGEFDEQAKSRMGELRAQAREMAAKTITGFSADTETAVRSFAMKEGLSEAEIDNVLLDPRSYKVLWKAWQFDKVAAGVKPAQAQVEKALKPSGASNKMPDAVRAKLDYGKAMKSAKTSAQKASVIEERLAGMFGGRR